ncbi:hypothetical protein EVAR_80839_1 [Eumeta japonica]|uniref:Sodium/potassium-transporting ATPase subunit beta-2 n=1 Tax=Eumeta variegata TaxID=151549 RepID=A0A4C1UZZ6_EUMVA|nr:hypothetical protein EVAR_80839_1 [Eumeta japonica]
MPISKSIQLRHPDRKVQVDSKKLGCSTEYDSTSSRTIAFYLIRHSAAVRPRVDDTIDREPLRPIYCRKEGKRPSKTITQGRHPWLLTYCGGGSINPVEFVMVRMCRSLGLATRAAREYAAALRPCAAHSTTRLFRGPPKILLFYLIFYAVLVGFFAAMLAIFYQTLDAKMPKWQLDSSLIGNNPGLGFRPMPDSANVESTLIYYKANDKGSVLKWAKIIDEFLKDYHMKGSGRSEVSGAENRVRCSFSTGRLADKQVCDVPVDAFDPCTSANQYNYEKGGPCVFLKLNKHWKSNASFQYLCKKGPRLSDAKIKEGVFDGLQIRSLMADEKFDATMNNTELDAWLAFKDVINNFLGNNKQSDYKNKIFNWVPQTYNTSENLPDKMPEDLKAYIKTVVRIYTSTAKESASINFIDNFAVQSQAGKPEADVVWVSCEGENPADVENIGAVQYIPIRGFPAYYYPFTNKEGYLSPLVAVYFENPTNGVLINIECKAWAKNIQYDRYERRGSVHFELMVDRS